MECATGENFDYLHENLLESVNVIHYRYPKGECAAGEKFDYLHENLLERVEALHYPKGEKSAPQAKNSMIYMKTYSKV